VVRAADGTNRSAGKDQFASPARTSGRGERDASAHGAVSFETGAVGFQVKEFAWLLTGELSRIGEGGGQNPRASCPRYSLLPGVAGGARGGTRRCRDNAIGELRADWGCAAQAIAA